MTTKINLQDPAIASDITNNMAFPIENPDSIVPNETRKITPAQLCDGVTIQAVGGKYQAVLSALHASLAPYIVGTTGNNDFSTIAPAIAQAQADGATTANPLNIYIKPGVYTGSFTLPPGINLRSMDGISAGQYISNKQNCSVKIVGTVTPVGVTGTSILMNGIKFTSPAAGIAINTTGMQGHLILEDCQPALPDASSTFLKSISPTNIILKNCSNPTRVGQLFDLRQATLSIYDSFLDSLVASISGASGGSSLDMIVKNSSLLGAGIDSPGKLNFLNCDGSKILITGTGDINGSITNSENFGISGTGGIVTLVNCSGSDLITGQVVALKYFCRESTGALSVIKNHVNFHSSDFYIKQKVIVTLSNTPTLLESLTLPINSAYIIKGQVIATNGGASVVSGTFSASAKRGAGNISLVQTPTLDIHSDSTATFSIVADTGLQAIAVEAIGVLATPYRWAVTFEIQNTF